MQTPIPARYGALHYSGQYHARAALGYAQPAAQPAVTAQQLGVLAIQLQRVRVAGNAHAPALRANAHQAVALASARSAYAAHQAQARTVRWLASGRA